MLELLTQLLATPDHSDSVPLGQGLGICMFTKTVSQDSKAMDPGTPKLRDSVNSIVSAR